MNPLKFMVVAGEPSGDLLAADLVNSIRHGLSGQSAFEPRFFGVGGEHMRRAGVDTIVDLTPHSVIGFSDVLKNIVFFMRLLGRVRNLAEARQPDAVICVDFSGFNRRLGSAIRQRARSRRLAWFRNWSPRVVQYVSPQVWASRPGRALKMREDFDLVLSLFPFEPAWYAKNAPGLRVEFVGHPLVERYADLLPSAPKALREKRLLLLPGSRGAELKRHLPMLREAVRVVRPQFANIEVILVVPNARLESMARSIGIPEGTRVVVGNLTSELMEADLALASTGTVTLECALFGVPTVTFYKTSWSTYQIGKRIVSVPYLTMPNLLANEAVFPEFVQHDANGQNVGRTAVELLKDRSRREKIISKLGAVVSSLGGAGASDRAAAAVLSLLNLRGGGRPD